MNDILLKGLIHANHFAAALTNCDNTGSAATPGVGCDLALPRVAADDNFIKTVLQIAFGIIGALAVIFVVIGGLKYSSSQGDPQEVSKAKNTIMYSVIGLVVAISAEAIVSFVLTSL